MFGVQCDFFGKILYLYMSKGFDRAKISFLRFLECLYPFMNNDDKNRHNQIAFYMLDIDNDNTLNILNLLHLQENLPMQSKIGTEIISLIEYYINNNLTKKTNSTNNTNPGINYDAFSKIVKKSSIIEEIREIIFGCELSGANKGQKERTEPHKSCFIVDETH